MNDGMSISSTNSRQYHKGAHCEKFLRRASADPRRDNQGGRCVSAPGMEQYGGGDDSSVPSNGVSSVSTISIVMPK